MFTTHGFSYWAVLGAVDLEAKYTTILVVAATAVMICYALFMITSHRYRLIPHWPSSFPTRKLPQATHGTREPFPDKGVPVDLFPFTCSEHPALADEPGSTSGIEVAAGPIAEPQASLVESEPRAVADHEIPSSRPGSGLEAYPELDINVSRPEGRYVEESSELEPPHTDGVLPDSPVVAHPEIELGADSADTEGKPRVVEGQEMVCTISGDVSDGSRSEDPQCESLTAVPASSFMVSTPEPADVDASALMEAPFLLAADSRRSVDDEATLGAERLAEDNASVSSPPAAAALAGSALVERPGSKPDFLHEDVSSDIMHSALLVPAQRIMEEGESSPGTAVGREIDDDDWTSVDPDEPSTPRPPSPAGLQPRMAEGTSPTWFGESDLAVSAVLLTESQYASVILSPNTVSGSSLSSPTSSTFPGNVRPRVHTSDRPDWAVAPEEEQEDDATRERTQRRHSADSPDWAVASEDTAGSTRKKGRKSDPGSGRRKKPRRAWASR